MSFASWGLEVSLYTCLRESRENTEGNKDQARQREAGSIKDINESLSTLFYCLELAWLNLQVRKQCILKS